MSNVAISGGGIRSACFLAGVLSSMSEARDLLNEGHEDEPVGTRPGDALQVQHLSSVSGGGFLAGALYDAAADTQQTESVSPLLPSPVGSRVLSQALPSTRVPSDGEPLSAQLRQTDRVASTEDETHSDSDVSEDSSPSESESDTNPAPVDPASLESLSFTDGSGPHETVEPEYETVISRMLANPNYILGTKTRFVWASVWVIFLAALFLLLGSALVFTLSGVLIVVLFDWFGLKPFTFQQSIIGFGVFAIVCGASVVALAFMVKYLSTIRFWSPSWRLTNLYKAMVQVLIAVSMVSLLLSSYYLRSFIDRLTERRVSVAQTLVWVGLGVLIAVGIILLRAFSFADWSIIIIVTAVGLVTVLRMIRFSQEEDEVDPFSSLAALSWAFMGILLAYPFLAMIRDKGAHRLYRGSILHSFFHEEETPLHELFSNGSRPMRDVSPRYSLVCHMAYIAEDSLRGMVVLTNTGGTMYQFRPDERDPPGDTVPEVTVPWLKDMRLITAVALSGAAIAHHMGRLQGGMSGIGSLVSFLSINLGSWVFPLQYTTGFGFDEAFCLAVLATAGTTVGVSIILMVLPATRRWKYILGRLLTVRFDLDPGVPRTRPDMETTISNLPAVFLSDGWHSDNTGSWAQLVKDRYPTFVADSDPHQTGLTMSLMLIKAAERLDMETAAALPSSLAFCQEDDSYPAPQQADRAATPSVREKQDYQVRTDESVEQDTSIITASQELQADVTLLKGCVQVLGADEDLDVGQLPSTLRNRLAASTRVLNAARWSNRTIVSTITETFVTPAGRRLDLEWLDKAWLGVVIMADTSRGMILRSQPRAASTMGISRARPGASVTQYRDDFRQQAIAPGSRVSYQSRTRLSSQEVQDEEEIINLAAQDLIDSLAGKNVRPASVPVVGMKSLVGETSHMESRTFSSPYMSARLGTSPAVPREILQDLPAPRPLNGKGIDLTQVGATLLSPTGGLMWFWLVPRAGSLSIQAATGVTCCDPGNAVLQRQLGSTIECRIPDMAVGNQFMTPETARLFHRTGVYAYVSVIEVSLATMGYRNAAPTSYWLWLADIYGEAVSDASRQLPLLHDRPLTRCIDTVTALARIVHRVRLECRGGLADKGMGRDHHISTLPWITGVEDAVRLCRRDARLAGCGVPLVPVGRENVPDPLESETRDTLRVTDACVLPSTEAPNSVPIQSDTVTGDPYYTCNGGSSAEDSILVLGDASNHGQSQDIEVIDGSLADLPVHTSEGTGDSREDGGTTEDTVDPPLPATSYKWKRAGERRAAEKAKIARRAAREEERGRQERERAAAKDIAGQCVLLAEVSMEALRRYMEERNS
ncbi:hypothetical protein KIPB_000244 [Kipferlia bialata]|uniref:Uncharacterized protein n=1 Tax=Kipferlia bialata TaxID=797122 RepID=A0A9K3CN95_9EUKA|nr:hypothetical protein KIPB_000244 [Kipferlia bialata]|eukprot:g244.t1